MSPEPPNRISRLLNSPGPTTPSPSPSGSPPASPSPAPSPSPSPSPSPAPSAPAPSSPAPSSPAPSAPPSGGGNGQVQNDHEAIKAYAKKVSGELGPKFTAIAKEVGSLDLAQTSFTAVTVALAIAYTESSAFFIQDMKSKNDQLGEIEFGLTTVAGTWQQADDKSTIKTV